jgi:hypothetical protein
MWEDNAGRVEIEVRREGEGTKWNGNAVIIIQKYDDYAT